MYRPGHATQGSRTIRQVPSAEYTLPASVEFFGIYKAGVFPHLLGAPEKPLIRLVPLDLVHGAEIQDLYWLEGSVHRAHEQSLLVVVMYGDGRYSIHGGLFTNL